MATELRELIQRAEQAEPGATDELFALLYAELHRLAQRNLRGAGACLTISPTTLLHETYLNMAGRDGVAFPDRARFLAYASRAMRGLVIDLVRHRGAQKRGRQLEITLTERASPSSARTAREMTRLSDALDELAALKPSLAELVDLHFFCGFTFAEIADLQKVSVRTVHREWRKARLLLHRSILSDA